MVGPDAMATDGTRGAALSGQKEVSAVAASGSATSATFCVPFHTCFPPAAATAAAKVAGPAVMGARVEV